MNDVFILLEPFNHMLNVIEAAHRRGYDIVTFHTLPIPDEFPEGHPMRLVSKKCHLSSWVDVDSNLAAVIDACQGRQVVGIYSAAEATLQLDAAIKEHFGLVGNHPEQVRCFLNKQWVRSELQKAGLSKLQYLDEKALRSLQSWDESSAYFLKPVNGAGSASVKRCTSLDDIRAAIKNWDEMNDVHLPILREYMKSGAGIFLEQAAEGELLSAEGVVYDGEYYPIGLTSRTVLERDPAVEMGCSFPYEHPLKDKIFETIGAIHNAIGFLHGVTHAELVVTSEGEIELVELNIRFIGLDALTMVNKACDVNFEDQLVALAVGEQPSMAALAEPKQFISMQYVLAPPNTKTLASFEVPGANLVYQRQMKPDGSELKTTDNQMDHIGCFMVRGDSYEDALANAERTRQQVKCNGQSLNSNPNNRVILR
ncbi:ATP-grasp domain-containing protein [Reinekea blandensis]|uniref:ATP-grasp domain-containing protein n=1 Tax=Reinekea blandensis MED297 TaxID=314283 RepID=A4BF18_9GAMM|nr:ATP-grasp domain-containing protein [Reinekea blandensis]EAR09353.1 hypothetical protein MED297_18733 [Reinekea sp. MED297] [Reinekea blandensis MED297]